MSTDPVIITMEGEAPAELVTEDEYAEREAARPAGAAGQDNGTTVVGTEAELTAALEVGGRIRLKNGGVIDCTTPKVIAKAWTTIEGPGHLRFSGLAMDARCLLVQATDVTLRDFEMSSTLDLAASNQSGINIPGYEPSVSHRAKLLGLDLHNWHTCVSKYGGVSTPYTDDILMEDCYLHTFRFGAYLTFGLRRFTMRRCRMLGKQEGETHVCDGNAAFVSSNIEDALIEDCVLGQCGLMGLEMTTVPEGHQIRPRVIRVRVFEAGSFGVSLGHCRQGYAEQVMVDGARGVGFEVAGYDVHRANATLVACDVRNVSDPAGGSTSAYTIDKADDTVLLGCRATNITSTPSNLANGVYVYEAERAAVLNCIFLDGGATGVHLYRGNGPNTGGFHVVQGCTFRHSVNVPYQQAVFVSDINTIVRHNTAFPRPGGTMGYAASCTPGAAVQFDGAAAVTSGAFSGSNSVISVSA